MALQRSLAAPAALYCAQSQSEFASGFFLALFWPRSFLLFHICLAKLASVRFLGSVALCLAISVEELFEATFEVTSAWSSARSLSVN